MVNKGGIIKHVDGIGWKLLWHLSSSDGYSYGLMWNMKWYINCHMVASETRKTWVDESHRSVVYLKWYFLWTLLISSIQVGDLVPMKPCEKCICSNQINASSHLHLIECQPIPCDTYCPLVRSVPITHFCTHPSYKWHSLLNSNIYSLLMRTSIDHNHIMWHFHFPIPINAIKSLSPCYLYICSENCLNSVWIDDRYCSA